MPATIRPVFSDGRVVKYQMNNTEQESEDEDFSSSSDLSTSSSEPSSDSDSESESESDHDSSDDESESDDSLSDEESDAEAGVTESPTIRAKGAESLRRRVAAFLPSLAEANAQLLRQRELEGDVAKDDFKVTSMSVDDEGADADAESSVGDDEEHDNTQYIEMNLALGVLEERNPLVRDGIVIPRQDNAPNDFNSSSDTSTEDADKSTSNKRKSDDENLLEELMDIRKFKRRKKNDYKGITEVDDNNDENNKNKNDDKYI